MGLLSSKPSELTIVHSVAYDVKTNERNVYHVVELSNRDIAYTISILVVIDDPITFRKKKILRFPLNPSHVYCVAQHRRLLLAGTFAKQVAMWDMYNGYCMVRCIEAEQEVYNVLSWDNRLFVTSGGSISRIKVWNVLNGSLLIDIGPHNGNNTNHMIRMGDCIVSCGNGDPRLLFL